MPNNTNMDIPIDESNTRYSKYFTNDKLLARLIEFYTSDSIIFHENKNIDSDVLLKNTDAIDKFKIDSYFQYRNLLYAIIKKGYFKKIGFIDSNTPSYAICNTNFRQAMKQFQWNSLTGVQSNHQAKTTVKNLSQKGHVYNYYFSKDLHQLIGLTPFTKEFETKLGEIWPIGFAIAFRTGLLTIKSLCNYLERDQPDPSLVQAIENFINDILDLKVDLVPKLSAIINLELSKRNYVLPLETVGPYRRSYFCLAIVNYLLCNKDIKLPTFYDTLENEKRSKYDIHAGMTDEQINEAKIRFLQQSYIRTTKKLAHKFTNSDNRISKHEKSIIRNKFRFNSTNSTLSNKMPAKPAAEDTPDPKLQEKMINNNGQESTINKLTPQIPENIVSSRSLVEARESNEITSSQNIDSATENFGDQRFKIITIDDSDDELPKQNNKSDAITNEIFHTLMNNETLLRWDETKDKYLIKFILNNLDDLKKDCTYKKLLVLEPQIFKGFKPENLRKRKEHLAKSYEYLMKLCGSEKIQTKEDKVVFEERIDSLRKLMNISVKMEVD